MAKAPPKGPTGKRAKPSSAARKKRAIAKAPSKATERLAPAPTGVVPVVGLGASAGGLQALSDFFEAMPDAGGMAFVVIHHADPDHESLMADLLAKHTRMTVTLAKDDTRIVPDNVYVIPPNRFLSMDNGVLRLTEPAERRGLRLPIDFFLRSLAEDQQQKAVAIILSGTGSDGAAGVRNIKAQGGVVLVQKPKDAAHDGMPRSAIATGSVDYIVSVKDMPAIILKYAKHPYVDKARAPKVLGDNARGSLYDIIAALKAYSPINFDLYKEGTLLRRIERRMALRHMENSADYLALLQDSPEEAARLCSDLLISVTSFFRDPEAFEYLSGNVLHDMVENQTSGQPIRVWVPACATGEEAYSLAILLIEKISALRKDVKLQVFASDVDETALSVARSGVYPDAIEETVSPERLERFFIHEDHTYRVVPELRDTVVFASQNILADAPFSKLDLISCRNLLIYLNADAQERIIHMFHFALNEDGILFLGSSETANAQEMYFRPVSKKYRVYRRAGGVRNRPINFPSPQRSYLGHLAPALRAADAPKGVPLADLSQKVLIEHYAPAAVLINGQMEALFVQGPADRYLKVPLGEASQDLLAMARDGMRAQLGSAVRKTIQQNKEVARTGTVTRDGVSVAVTIKVHPMRVEDAQLYLVTFTDQPVTEPAPSLDDVSKGSAAYQQLEKELETTRLDLQNTIRDFELSTEELKAANEEAMSMNEEFQSTNEELETSKEELQSLNEELTTLNSQLQQKVDDERRLSDDLNNLLSSSGVATLFLDPDLNIKRFTPATRDLFNLITNDVGRPFSDITGKIDDPDLLNDARRVISELTAIEVEVQATDGRWFIRRLLPYRTQSGQINGVVVTFTDVSDIKNMQEAHKQAQRFAENIVSTVREPMLVLDNTLAIVRASLSFHKLFQTSPEQIEGQVLFDLQGQQWDRPRLRQLLERILPNKTTVEDYEIKIDTARLGKRTMLLNARTLEGENDHGTMILLALEDVTERKRIQADLEEREARLRAILDAAPEAIITIDEHGIVGSYSPAAESLLGFPANEVIGKNVSMLMPAPDRDKHDSYISHYIRTGEKRIIGIGREMNACRRDGTIIPIRLTVAEWWIEGKRYFTGIIHDLTEDMQRRDALNRVQKMEAVGQLTGGLAHDFNNLLTVIIGNLELLDMHLGDHPKRDLLVEALEASNLGAQLTAQMLAFSRNQALTPEIVALNTLVRSLRPMLTRTLGEQITIETELADDLRMTLTDPGQIESAILNLALNARDAMPDGGTLGIATWNAILDEDYAATQVDVTPGVYVALAVTDTGHGMTPDVINRVFEPFFTTKGPGAGSGLGLSMVYGFAKQSGGHVAIDSTPGVGTKITLFLPVASEGEAEFADVTPDMVARSSDETILVVEDDPCVRRLTVMRLNELGYQVIAAEDGPTAIEVLRKNGDIDLILSDVVMPGGMSGFEVAEKALEINPDLKVLLATGYAKSERPGNGEPATPHKMLRKPYSLQELAQSLHELLD
ncbi:chemotaxis protein CheB [Sulfitobacter sabulilitoris]|uniref:Sensor protein FixL n=1 Tax=Sulfitobacter sabulilitoris TaxID=2562655 RepID=A0A5S3PBK1_9RHOB|nr:chemotaxis protein CheB [Sulfitobacter sabulilitoris]TMM51062.1 PAS domain S-box protein [Sulfitobacter sabulilitoris]